MSFSDVPLHAVVVAPPRTVGVPSVTCKQVHCEYYFTANFRQQVFQNSNGAQCFGYVVVAYTATKSVIHVITVTPPCWIRCVSRVCPVEQIALFRKYLATAPRAKSAAAPWASPARQALLLSSGLWL